MFKINKPSAPASALTKVFFERVAVAVEITVAGVEREKAEGSSRGHLLRDRGPPRQARLPTDPRAPHECGNESTSG